MSYYYYQFLRTVKRNIPTFQLFYLQCLQLLSYIYFILSIYTFYHSTNDNEFLSNFIIISFFFFIGRGLSIYIRNLISEKTQIFKKTFPESERKKLFKEVETSLKKSQDFAKWSCGILATCIVLLITLFFNYYLSFIDKLTISQEELTKLATDFTNLNDLIFQFFTLLTIVVGFVLLYYFILQFFTYYKRLVLKILTNCSYDTPYNFLNLTKWEKRKNFIREVFFLPLSY